MSPIKRWLDWWSYNWTENRWAVIFRVAIVLALVNGGAMLYQWEQERAVEPEVQKAWVQVGLMVLSIGLSILAGQMLAKKNGSPIKDDKPTTLTTRGSFMPWFVGIRRVGPVFCWAGDREIRKEEVEGAGKGGDEPEQDVFYEAGWHVLGIGQVTALHRIIQAGKTIFTGPITNESHPSGTTVDLGKEGSFVIYWGEANQPINTFLGNANRVTISSRWPHTCYILWNKKRMGTSPNWPIVDYVLERRPSTSFLTQSDGWYEPGITLSGDDFSIIGHLASANEQTGYLQIAGDKSAKFKPQTFVEILGNGLPDGTYEVLKSTVVVIQTGTSTSGFPLYSTFTRIFLQGGTSGATTAGTIEYYVSDDTDGANIAHVIAELLFADFPQGLQIDPNHMVERWDLESLEALGVEAETDEWRASVMGTEGETAEALLGAMIQDHGVMLPIDTSSGNLLFQRVRFPTGTIPQLSDDIYADSLPEIESIHGEQPVDRLVFSFSDRANEFGDMTIAVDEDGQASYMEHQRARKVPLVSTVQFTTAAKLSELRSPEELAHGGEFRIDAGREARELIPGQAILADGFDEVLRVTGVEIDPLNERVQIKVLPDFYGAPKSTFVTNPGGTPPPAQDPEPDEAFAWVEAPEQILGTFPSEQVVLIPHIRAHSLISFASLWLSRDNSTYTLFGNDSFVQTGGTLDDPLPDTGPTYVDQGPEYTELGPDNSTLTQDLSADLTNWGLGRQLCVIVSDAGTEICFLQRATITGGSTRRLDGLLRARYDTRKLDHPAGAFVFIFDMDAITPVTDLLLVPDEDLYVKTQPGTTAGQVNLSAVPPFGEHLVGKGQVPIRPDYVYVRAPFRGSPSFQTGDDITVSWAISTGTPGTGCGGQSAGVAIQSPVIPGTVQLELLTTGDVLKLTVGLDANDFGEYTITNAELVAAFGAEPTSFKARVTHISNGQASAVSPSLTITRVA